LADNTSKQNNIGKSCPVLNDGIKNLSHQILEFANRGIPRVDFLRQIFKLLSDFSQCDILELWLSEGNIYIHCAVAHRTHYLFQYEALLSDRDKNLTAVPRFQGNSILDSLRIDVIRGKYDSFSTYFTSFGSFWTGEIEKYLDSLSGQDELSKHYDSGINGSRKSLSLIPITYGNRNIGLLELASEQPDYFTKPMIELFEEIARILAIALTNQRSQAALQERVKELTCLYSIAQIRRRDYTKKEILQSIAKFLPPAWQYPDITAAMISLDGYVYSTPGFKPSGQKQVSDIVIKDETRGTVEVIYLEKMPELDEGPFLREERKLIDTIARQIALIIGQAGNNRPGRRGRCA